MLRSCLFLLICYALLFVGYAWWLGTMFDPPGQFIGAAVVALIVGGSLGALYNALVAYREWSPETIPTSSCRCRVQYAVGISKCPSV